MGPILRTGQFFGKRGLLRKLVDDLQCWMGRIKGRICHRNMFYGAESSSGKRLELEVLCVSCQAVMS